MRNEEAAGELSRGRSLVTTVAMLGASVAFARTTGDHDLQWLMLAFAAVLAGSGLALTRGSLLTRVLARGAAWLMVAETLTALVVFRLADGNFRLDLAAIVVPTCIALFASRPALDTPSARVEFAPVAWRRLFLAGATSAAALGLGLVCDGTCAMARTTSPTLAGLGFLTLAAGMLASVVGVLRMRGWGVLVGAVSSFLLLVAAALGVRPTLFPYPVVALPMLVGFLGPVVLARLGRTPAPVHRVSLEEHGATRVALDEPMDAEEVFDEAPLPARTRAL